MSFYISSIVSVLFISTASAQLDCTLSQQRGTVEVPLYPEWSPAQFERLEHRLPLIQKKLKESSTDKTFSLFYEFAKPYDPNQETIFISAGFYPWVILDFIKNNFPFLFKNFNLFHIHYRGSGCSSLSDQLSPILFAHEFVAHDVEYVRKKFQIKKLNSWASSNGSWVALTYALLFPDRVDKFLLRDTAIRKPSLVEASEKFETLILPELLVFKTRQQLNDLQERNKLFYRELIRFINTALIRKQTERDMIESFVDQIYSTLIAHPESEQELLQMLREQLGAIPPWGYAITSNECIAGEYDPLLDYQKISVVSYVFQRCQDFKKTYAHLLIPELDFRGVLKDLKNTFFVYQGYWDDYLTKDLAEDLYNELPNSRIVIDRTAGHGEITPATYPCFNAIVEGFFGEVSEVSLQEQIQQKCQQ